MDKGKKKKQPVRPIVRGISVMGIAELCPEINSPQFLATSHNTILSICETFKIALNNYLKDKSATPQKLCIKFLLDDCDSEIRRSEKESKREEVLLALRVVLLQNKKS